MTALDAAAAKGHMEVKKILAQAGSQQHPQVSAPQSSYRQEIRKLHSGMSETDLVAALGEPYGELPLGNAIIYYRPGSNRELVVHFDRDGACG